MSSIANWRLTKAIKQFFKLLNPKKSPKTTLDTDDLINAESEIGSKIFGQIPITNRRDFFYHDQNTWVWYEEGDHFGIKKSFTVRYEVRKEGVFKHVIGKEGKLIFGDELQNFCQATEVYLFEIKQKLY